MDWQALIRQEIPRTRIQRGGLTAWPKGAAGLIGDSLGPVLHLHDDASEIFYFVSGRCRMEVGDQEETFEAGEFVLVPPLVPHNLWNGGDDDLVLLWLVAPNLVGNKWRTGEFPPGSVHGRVIRGRVDQDGELPGDGNIESGVHRLTDGVSRRATTGEMQEVVIYVLEGTGVLTLAGRESPIEGEKLLYVPAVSDYTMSAETSLRYLELRAPA